MTETAKKTTRREHDGPRRIAESVLDVAIGGTALVVDKAVETVSRTVERGSRQVRRIARPVAPDREHSRSEPYEERSFDDLYTLASERDIPGRSSMNKDDLIAALRERR
jgi:hypothetical protein